MNESKDSFEDFFHQSYKDSEVINQAGDWNMPSDAVWEGIQEGMTEERKLSFIFLKWPWSAIAASYLLLMGGYQFSEKYIQQNDFASTIVTEEVVVNNNLQSDNFLSANESIRPENINEKKQNIEVGIAENPNKKRNVQPISDIDNNRLYSENLGMSAFKKSDLSFSKNNTLIDNVDNQSFLNGKLTTGLLNIELLENLSNNNLQSLVSLTTNETTINIPSITTPVKKQSNLYISANYTTRSEALKPNDLSKESSDQLIANTMTSKGSSTGVDLGWKNKNGWAIETGVHFATLENETVVNQVIPTDQIKDNLNADGTSNVQLAWNDANGGNEVGLAMNNPTAIDTDLSLQLTQNTQNRFVEIPLLVRKNWSIGKLNVSVKTGLLNRFNISNSFEEPAITLEDDQFEVLASEFRRNSTIENTKYIPQLVAGIGLEYFIQPNLSVYVDPSFSKSIRPIIDFGFANIHSQNKAVTMGLRYHL